MTIELSNEQAANELKAMQEHVEPYMSVVGLTAYNMAIKALEQQPCEDCISREDVLKVVNSLTEICDSDIVEKITTLNNIDWIKMKINEIPSVTPSRPKGKWIHWTDDYKDYVSCSCCEYGEEGEVLLSDKTPFCPICGADMREGEE